MTSWPRDSISAASALSRRQLPQYIVPAPPVNDRILMGWRIGQCSSGLQLTRGSAFATPPMVRRAPPQCPMSSLFDVQRLPDGFHYHEAFITADEERGLLSAIATLEFHEVRMRGVAAKRRVIQYGWKYSFESFKMTEGPPVPPFLLPVRDLAAGLAELPAN